MKPFLLTYTPEARRRIQKLHPAIKKQVRLALEGLRENPWIGKRLQRELSGIFSLRVKNHRVLYWIDEEKKILEVLTLGPRKTVYEEAGRL